VSDRRQYVDIHDLPKDFKIYYQGLRNFDIYIKDLESDRIERVTSTPNLEGSPVFSPKGDRLAYVSDASGIFNIYIYDLESGINYPITNVITGIFNLSWHGDENKLAFVSFYNAGYDIYLLKNPLKILPGTVKLEETNFIAKHGHNELERNYAAVQKKSSDRGSKLDESLFQNFVFDEKFAEGRIEIEPTKKSVFLDSADYKSSTGEYRINKYRVKFSPDILYGSASYSQFYGVQGLTQIALSDVLGNHRIDIYTNLFYDLRNSNYELMYFYLPRQTDWGIGGYHYTYFYYIYNPYFPTWARDRFFGLNLYASHPFSKFTRVDGTLQWVGIDRDLIQWEIPTEKVRLLLAGLYLVKDTVLWGYTGPINGHRYMVGLNYSPGVGSNSYNFLTLKLDYRKYLRVGRDYNFVYRLSAGLSEGKNPHTFFLGGTSGWLNYKTRGGLRVANVNDIYFSSFEVPMRGGYYYERYGDRFVLNNLEFRFPLIRYFVMGWPIPLGLQDIRGALFTDVGAAWFGDKFRGAQATDGGFPALKDIFLGYGIGARMNLGFFIFRFDVAWSSDLANYTHGPFYYFSLGSEF